LIFVLFISIGHRPTSVPALNARVSSLGSTVRTAGIRLAIPLTAGSSMITLRRVEPAPSEPNCWEMIELVSAF
jgi:hypothetical protein